MPSTIITMGGYQPPGSVNNQACEEFGRGLQVRLGDEVRFDFDGDMVSTSPQSRDLLSCRSDNRSKSHIVRVQMDFEKQCTNLKIVRQRSQQL